MTPFISCICITYGRTRFLESAIADFLAQDCSVPVELVILNTFPQQRFVPPMVNNPDKHILLCNLPERPKSLGEARNMAIEDARGEWIVVWDDDDAALPHFLSTFANALMPFWPGIDWLWQEKRIWAEGSTIKGIVGGCHGACFAFTKKAWREVGGYPALSVGEDKALIAKITAKFQGKKIPIEGTPPFVCIWGQGSYHISGEGEDRPDRISAHDRAEAALIRRIGQGERVGTIELKPFPLHDWPTLAANYMAEHSKKKHMNNGQDSVCIIQLGRYGDIVNILPIALHVHNQFAKPHLMVSREFASLLDGVSYVTPYVVDLNYAQLDQAIELANKEFKHVIICQIYGNNIQQERQTPAYNVESWLKAGFAHKFGDHSWKPLFDRRDRERERLLINKAKGPQDGPVLILAAQSVSSPFPHVEALNKLISDKYGEDFTVVDLTPLRSERIYDILGLIEEASVLVTVDTAVLHLAAATDTPTVCIVNQNPWFGSVPRCRSMAGLPYDKFSEGFDDRLNWALNCNKEPRTPPALTLSSPPARRLIHACEMHPARNPAEENRRGIAQESWKALYAQNVIPAHLHEAVYPRNATGIGDPRPLPYLKDVLMQAMAVAAPDDIIFWSNDDNWLHPELPDLLRYHVSLYECCCSQRCEFINAPMPPPNAPPVEFAIAGRSHMGRDIFAFTKRWLEEHWEEIPDSILGGSDWDLHMCCIIRRHFGIKSTRRNIEDCIWPAELTRGYVSHTYHPPGWNNPATVNTMPSNVHNRRLFKEWAGKYAPHLVFDAMGCI